MMRLYCTLLPEEHFMRRNGLCLSLLLISVVGLSQPARSQGIGEMGGAYAASSGQTPVLMNSAGSLSGPMGAATKSINSSTSGAAGTSGGGGGSSGSGGHVKSAAPRDGDEPPTPQQTAKKAAEMSNKAYTLGQAKYKAGDYDSADKLFKEALYYRERIWGAKDPAVPKMYDILGDIARKRSVPAEAEKYYDKSLMTMIKVYGQGEYVLVPALSKLGALYLDTSKFADAVNTYQQIYTLTSRKLGDDSDLTVQAAIHLGKAYIGDEDFRQAANLLRDYATKLDKGPESNLQQLAAVLDLYQAALQKTTHAPDALQRVQSRLQEVTDQLASQKAIDTKTSAPASTESSATRTEKAAAPAAGATAPATVPATAATPATTSKAPATDPAKPAASNASKPGAPEAKK
jgi:tetratricopeptide (TPR) repeat protein